MFWREDWQASRDKRARLLRDIHQAVVTSKTASWDERRTALRVLRKHQLTIGEVPPKPTDANLLAYADTLEESAASLIQRVGERDTEYYSACGHDDYLIESAEACKAEADAIRLEISQ